MCALMDMLNVTLITLAWELYQKGVPKAHIAQRLGRHRETIHLWIRGDRTRMGCCPFSTATTRRRRARDRDDRWTLW